MPFSNAFSVLYAAKGHLLMAVFCLWTFAVVGASLPLALNGAGTDDELGLPAGEAQKVCAAGEHQRASQKTQDELIQHG